MEKRKRKPTDKQKRAVAIATQNPEMSVGEVMRKAGYSESTSLKPKQNFTDLVGTKTAIDEIRQELTNLGITMPYIASKYKEWLEAQKVVGARVIVNKNSQQSKTDLPNANSNTDDFIEVPDYQTQIKAAEFIRKDFGLEEEGKLKLPDNIKSFRLILDVTK